MSTTSRTHRALAVLVAVTLALLGLAVLPGTAGADTAPPSGTPATVSADALPTPQVDGVVWKTAVVGNTVYAVGSFTTARPAGKPAGDPSQVARANILAFDLTTGDLLPFAPVLNAQALSIAVSPDNSEIYVGGDFTQVGNVSQPHIAAFNVSTGALDPNFHPSISAEVRAIALTSTTAYVGGTFTSVGGHARTRLAALRRSDGALLPWAPTADDDLVEALLTNSAGTRVIVGGRFQTLDGQPHVGIGAVDGTTGALQPWSSTPVPAEQGTNRSWVTSLAVANGIVYAGDDGEGSHWFDGRFAANFDTGDLVWLDNCYGATYGIAPENQVLYSVSHAHDCTSLGAFPQSNPETWHRGLAETTYATGTDQAPPATNSSYSHQPIPSLLHWYPEVNTGTYTGMSQGAWAVSATSQYVVFGGEFTQINGAAQQGLVRFAVSSLAPNKEGPLQQYNADVIPTATSIGPGTARVTWKGVWDKDNATLTYDVLRDGGTTPIYTVKANSEFWNLPSLTFTDDGLAPGSQHRYAIRVTDPFGNTFTSPKSAPVTVASTPPSAYVQDVVAGNPTHYWRLDQAAGVSSSYDYAGAEDLAAGSGVAGGTAGAINGDSDTASTFDGTANGFAATGSLESGPTTFSLEAWVKTTSTSGGKVVGFGNAKTGGSRSYDRQIYLDNAGHVYFGVYTTAAHTVNSAGTYNDGNWHHVVATLGSKGMTLYVDGVQVGQSTAATTAKVYSGYWRIGGDSLANWPGAPTSGYLNGAIDDVAVYPAALSMKQVEQHLVDSGRIDGYGSTVKSAKPTLFWRTDETSGTTAVDASGNNRPGTYTGGITFAQPGAIQAPGTSIALNGTSGAIHDPKVGNAPTTYSEELWFNAITTRGGELIGFGSSPTGSSHSHDRHVIMLHSGQLQFGSYTTKQNTILSPKAYNDGKWHYLAATQSSAGMRLYVDGTLVASNTVANPKVYSGYWRVTGDGTWGNTLSNFFHGSLDEIAVYPTALTAAQIQAHWKAGVGS